MSGQRSSSAERTREGIIDDVVRHLGRHGMGDPTLRQIAAAIGTSHRMLIYYFGSREGLLTEVVQVVEARQRRVMGELADTDTRSMDDAARQFWRRVSDPSLDNLQRLFFELYGQALQGRRYAADLLDHVVDDWVTPLAELFARVEGLDVRQAHAEARLGIAVVRGLLLDLLTTGDQAAADAAFEHYLAQRHRARS